MSITAQLKVIFSILHFRRIQYNGDGLARTFTRRPLQPLWEKVFPKKCPDVGGSNDSKNRICAFQTFPPQRY